MSFGFRAFASILVPISLAVASPAAAGDVDTRLDRSRGRAEVVRSSAGSASTGPIQHLDAAKGPSEITVARGQTVTVVVMPRGEQACSFELRAK